jgi:hypothetical protein
MNTAGQINSRVSADSGEQWREPPGCPGYLMHGPTREVWSTPRAVPAKGGATRTIASRRIRPSKGRVSLSIDGVRSTHSVNQLWCRTFPELLEQQNIERYRRSITRCRRGHPLAVGADVIHGGGDGVVPHIAYWGSFNRVCLLCNPHIPERPAFDKGHHSAFWGAICDRGTSRAEYHPDSLPPDSDGVAEWIASAGVVTRPN